MSLFEIYGVVGRLGRWVVVVCGVDVCEVRKVIVGGGFWVYEF